MDLQCRVCTNGGVGCSSVWWGPQSAACERWSDEWASPEMSYCSGGDWGSYKFMTPLICICYRCWRASHPFSPHSWQKIAEPSRYLGCSCEPGDEDIEVSASKLTKRMKHFASVLNHFWRRWRSEYLNELRESHRHGAKNTRNTHIANGEVVIVHDDFLPYGLWKLGRVQEVIPGADGLPRCALVWVASRDN